MRKQTFWLTLSLSVATLCHVHHAQAAPAMSLGAEPKYPADFTHFGYYNPDAPKGGSIVLRGLGSFDSLNPFILKGINPRGMGLLYETLMVSSMDEPLTVYQGVADDISFAEDQLSVTFRINPAAKFQNGDPVRPQDVKFSFDTIMSQGHPMYRFFWGDVKDCEVIDDSHVRFNFKRRNRELHLTIATQLAIFSPVWLDGKKLDEVTQTPPLGSGPYVLESMDLGKTITFKRDPNYWARDLNVHKGEFNFDKVTVKYFQDETIALEGLKAGEFDFMDMYNSKTWATATFGPQFDSSKIVKTQLAHKNNAGMQAFVFNLRRPLFQDIRVRQAINLAFDFEWANKNLFYDQYQRCDSYFTNSELGAPKALPEGKELELLKALQTEFPEQFPAAALSQVWQPVSTAKPNSLRGNLRQAQALLKQAGWNMKDGVLQNAKGEAFKFETILVQRGFERILAPFVRNLKRLGIEVSYRTVDEAVYKSRLDVFDYDMIVTSFAQSQSPGNEQLNFWHSDSLDKEGSSNYIGLHNPLIDAVVERLIGAEDRDQLVLYSRVLDRILLASEYVVPHWYINSHRVLYWDKFGIPATAPLYYPTGESWAYIGWWDKTLEKAQ